MMAVGDRERPGEALVDELAHHGGKGLRQRRPRPWAGAGGREAADRVDACAHVDRGGRKLLIFHQRDEMPDRIARRRAEVEVDGDAGVERDAVEHPRECRGRGVEAESVGADRAGEHQRQAARAVLEVLQRLAIGGRRIGMVDPLHQGPCRARRAAGDRQRVARARVKRLDRQLVVGARDELVERRALERAVDQLEPLLAGGGREFGAKHQVIGHAGKMPRVAA